MEEGENGLIHKNRGKVNPNKIDDNIIQELKILYLDEYYDYNFEQYYEVISSNYNISYDVMLKSFTKDDIISPLAHKKTVKEYPEKMKCIEEETKEETINVNIKTGKNVKVKS